MPSNWPAPDSLSGLGRQVRVATVYTGDLINGKKVVRSLNTEDLEPGKKHRLYFQGVQMASGQSLRCPTRWLKNAPQLRVDGQTWPE